MRPALATSSLSRTPDPAPATDAGGVVIALPFRREPVGMTLCSLTESELEVAFYAANYWRCHLDTMAYGHDVMGMAASVQKVIDELGMDLVRQTAALVDYAKVTLDLTLLRTIFPDRARESGAMINARVFRAQFAECPSGVTVSTVRAEWLASLSTYDARTAAAVAA